MLNIATTSRTEGSPRDELHASEKDSPQKDCETFLQFVACPRLQIRCVAKESAIKGSMLHNYCPDFNVDKLEHKQFN